MMMMNDRVEEESDEWCPGFYFEPTDEDIVGFLKKIAAGEPLPADASSVIRHVEVYGDKPPWEIFAGDFPEMRLFFVVSCLKKLTKGRMQRTAGGGTWKRQSVSVRIAVEDVVGEKYTLSFMKDQNAAAGDVVDGGGAEKKKGNKKRESCTHWNMTEYRLMSCCNDGDMDSKKEEETVFCRIIYSGKESPYSSVSIYGGKRNRDDQDTCDSSLQSRGAGNKKARVSSSSISSDTESVAPPPGGQSAAAEDQEMGDNDDAYAMYLEGQLLEEVEAGDVIDSNKIDDMLVQTQSEKVIADSNFVEARLEEEEAADDSNRIVVVDDDDDAYAMYLERHVLEEVEAADDIDSNKTDNVLVQTQLEEVIADSNFVQTQLEEEEAADDDVSNKIVVIVDDDDDDFLDLIDFNVPLWNPDDEPPTDTFPFSEDETTASNAEMMITEGVGQHKGSAEMAPVGNKETNTQSQLVHHASVAPDTYWTELTVQSPNL